MRQVILDTETTGLEVQRGHRVIEIGCVELIQRRPSGRTFQCYLNPDRLIEVGARAVTGIDDGFLLDKPRFAEIAEEFLAFIDGAEIVAHNAAFDVGFIDAELARAGLGSASLGERANVLDTLALARERFPGQRNSLDALCRRLGVDNSHRESHGALIDAQLLADVYLALTAGQGQLGFAASMAPTRLATGAARPSPATRPIVVCATDDELALHVVRLAAIDQASDGGCVWKRLAADG